MPHSNSIILTELGGQVTDLDEALFLSLPNFQAQVKVHSCCHKAEGPSISEQGMILFHPERLLTKSCRDLCDNYLTQCEKLPILVTISKIETENTCGF